MIDVRRLNHAVLFVRNLERSIAFYRETFGFELVTVERGMMAFLRARHSTNHHDLGLAVVGAHAPSPPQGAVGLYHLAWEVERIEDLAEAYRVLQNNGAITGASDHGATKSVYGLDPDGNEFEIMWPLPLALRGEFEKSAPTNPLDLAAELERHRTVPAG